MATRCNIAVKVKEEDFNKELKFDITKLPKGFKYADKYIESICSIKTDSEKPYLQIYCHWDGYPSGVGDVLINYFNDYETALNLVLGGFASCVEVGNVVQYCAWRNDDWDDVKPEKLDIPHEEEAYLYVFEDGKWQHELSK